MYRVPKMCSYIFRSCFYKNVPSVQQVCRGLFQNSMPLLEEFPFEENFRHQYEASEMVPKNGELVSEKMLTDFSIESILSGSVSQNKVAQRSPCEVQLNAPPAAVYYNMQPHIMEKEASRVQPNDEGKYECYLCNKSYSRRHQLKIHFRNHTGYKPLTCKYCKKSFGDKSNFNKHKKIHINVEDCCPTE